MPEAYRAFLDANVLFSAAWRPDAGVARLLTLSHVECLACPYAVEEARTNLPAPEQRERLEALLQRVTMVPDQAGGPLPSSVTLPDKDRPILLSAIAAKATHLVTGDRAHFGGLYGRSVGGVRIVTPAIPRSRPIPSLTIEDCEDRPRPHRPTRVRPGRIIIGG